MSPIAVPSPESVSARVLAPLVGSVVVMHTAARTIRGTLLSCVQASAWLVVDDVDEVVPLTEVLSVSSA